MSKQVYQCRTKKCQNRTYRTMPSVEWLQMEIVECEKCRQLIVFSTLYEPTLYRMNVPIWKNGRVNGRK